MLNAVRKLFFGLFAGDPIEQHVDCIVSIEKPLERDSTSVRVPAGVPY